MGSKRPQLTIQTLKVLTAFTSATEVGLSGAEIAKHTGLLSGTLYPILLRLEKAGWLESTWEKGDPRQMRRPRRRLYRITALGAKSARSACRDVTAVIGGLSWVG
jgi:PadR family transcriptional regulator, regulatory protein PadR